MNYKKFSSNCMICPLLKTLGRGLRHLMCSFLKSTLKTRWFSLVEIMIRSKLYKNKYKGLCRKILTQMKWQNLVIQLKWVIHIEHKMEIDRILPNYKKKAKIEAKGENFLARIGTTSVELGESLAFRKLGHLGEISYLSKVGRSVVS